MKRLLLILTLAVRPLTAATLTATGGWSNTLTVANLTAGAGSNLPSTLESDGNIITLELTNTPLLGLGFYHVYARVAATGLPPGVTLSVRRTSDGVSFLGLGVIIGGTSYVTLGTTDTEIFYGTLDRSSINIQLQATGVSVAMLPALYSSSVIFSVTP